MLLRRGAVLAAGIALALGLALAARTAAQDKKPKNDIWKDEPRAFQRDLSKDQIEQILKGIQQRDPAKAKTLTELRQKDPGRFINELRTQGRPELDQMFRDRIEARRQERYARFLEWLKVNYPAEEQTLAKLKEGDLQVYLVSLENVWDRYGYIFDAENSNPELGAVLKEDLALRKKGEELCTRHRKEKSEAERQKIGAELQDVVARRYDLIVRRKEIAYEQLLKRLEDLQKQVTDSKDDIAKFKGEQIKRENVRQRVEALVGGKGQFKWD